VVLIRYLLWMGDQAVHAAARQVLHSVLDGPRAEELMRSYSEQLIEQGVEKGLARGLEKGLTRGRAEDVLRILTARGVQADEAARQRILPCSDVATLDRWFDRALNATSLSDVLDDLAQ
jgi:NAD-specific glutamate dehydrogenase